MTVTRNANGYEISAMISGYRVSELYIGYTKAEAVARFKAKHL